MRKRRIFARIAVLVMLCILLATMLPSKALAEEAFNFNKYLSTGNYRISEQNHLNFGYYPEAGERFVVSSPDGYLEYSTTNVGLYELSSNDCVVWQTLKIYAPSCPAYFSVIPRSGPNKNRTVVYKEYDDSARNVNSDETTEKFENDGRAYGSFSYTYLSQKGELDESRPYLSYKNSCYWHMFYEVGMSFDLIGSGRSDPKKVSEKLDEWYEEFKNSGTNDYSTEELEIAGVRVIKKERVKEKESSYLSHDNETFYETISYTKKEKEGLTYYEFAIPITGSPAHYLKVHFSVWDRYGTDLPDNPKYVHEGVEKTTNEYKALQTAIVNEVLTELIAMDPVVEYGEIQYGPAYEEIEEPEKIDVVVDTYAEDEPSEDSTISSEEEGKSGKKDRDKERDKDEDKKSKGHEDGGTTIPAIIILGTLGTAGAAAAAGAAGSGSEKPDGSDEKKRSTFKMYINKDFGNKLKKGDEPKAVYARIVERKPSGEEVDRTDLTEQIQVFSSDGSLVVTDGGMSTNGYRCAMACVPEVDEPESEGKVSFFFEGEGGTFTQNVIFNITIPGIKFFQDNLTLPAGELDEPEFLPFEVQEMGDKYDIEVSYNGEDYEIDLAECDDPEMKDVHYVALMEKNKQVFDAGVYTESWVNVTVKNETQKITASVKIIRMSMGLNITVKALNCYRVPKKESAGKEMKKMTIADFETATTEAMAYVLYYDKEEHVVRQQAAFPSVTLEPLDGEAEERKKQVSESLAQIKINCKLLRTEDQFSVCVFVCEGGFLDAPARYNVKLCMTAEIPVGEGEKQHMVKYQAERIVLLRSQPSRIVAGVKENYEVDKYDDQITDMLYQIKKIVFDNYMNNLFSLYHMIDRMVDGYDRAYGYDPYQVAKVVDVWERFQSGEMLGANAEAKGYGVADELEALAAATRSWDGWQGIVLRISLDVMTGGASEIAMVALDMNRGAMDYRKETGGQGTTFGYFKAAGIPLLFGAGFGVAAAVGKGASKLVGTQAKKLFPKKTAALLKKAEAVKNTAKEMAELAAKDVKAAAGYVSTVIPQGAKTASAKIGNLVNAVVETVDSVDPRLYVPKAKMANSVVSTSVNKGKTTGDALIGEAKAAQKNIREKCIDMAGNATNKEGEIIYNEMIAAKKALQADPTSGAAQLRYNQSLMEFKASHAAIEHANSIMPGQELNMRQLIGDDLERTLTSRVEEKLKKKIANKYNIDPKTVKIERATANKGAGLKLGRDCDMTPKVVTKEGGTKYVSQATADELLEESVRETIEETCGKGYANKFAKKGKFSQKMDFTGCTVQHADYFKGGLDTVQQVTDKARMSEFMGAEQARSVADTLRYKGVHPYEAGAKLEKEVLSKLTDGEADALLKELEAYAKADANVAKTMQLSENAKKLKEAYALMEEGLYQPSKYGKKVVEKEWVSIKAGYGETLTGQDYVNARILDRGSGQALTEEMKHRTEEWVGERITLSEARKACELNGTTIEKAINGVGDAFERLDKNFKYGSVSSVTSAVGVGGAINAGRNVTNGSKKK